MQITKEQLHHLANLAKIEIPSDQEEKYLNDLQGIIGFLETLQVDNQELDEEKPSVQLFESAEEYPNPKQLLQNTKHEISNDCISIKTSLNH